MAFGVPVKVIVDEAPEQMVVGVALTVAVGSGATVMVVELVAGFTQLGVPELATLTILMVVLAVKVLVRVAVPDALNVIVWLAPPLML